MSDNRSKNQAMIRFILLPTIFLTVALMGGLRIDSQTKGFLFIAPPLISLVLAVLLMTLFARARLIELHSWLTGHNHPSTNIAHALVLGTLFFASAQAFNSVLPETGLFRWMFSFFLQWTLWNNQFSSFDVRRLLRSLAVLFGTAFVLKHMLLASLYAPDGGWLKRLASTLLEGVTLGTIDGQTFAPATGYISFFTLALYTTGLVLLPAKADEEPLSQQTDFLVEKYQQLPPAERTLVREMILTEERVGSSVETKHKQIGPEISWTEEAYTVDQSPVEEPTTPRK